MCWIKLNIWDCDAPSNGGIQVFISYFSREPTTRVSPDHITLRVSACPLPTKQTHTSPRPLLTLPPRPQITVPCPHPYRNTRNTRDTRLKRRAKPFLGSISTSNLIHTCLPPSPRHSARNNSCVSNVIVAKITL